MKTYTLLLLIGILAGALFLPSSVSAATPSAARLFGTDIADAVEHVMPAVVVIRTRETRMHMAHDWFYGHYQIPEELAGQGSGMIITEDGYVLTNNHVIDSADEIEVVLQDGIVYAATLIGRDYNTDLAVLKINEEGKFPHVEFTDSDALRVGEFVVAIGSPFSLQSTVTLGIISQIGRIFAPTPFVDYIQTDAAINRGNSGGPLIDVDGKVAGVNTFIQTASPHSPGSIGIGFAVPANLAQKVSQSIIETGSSQIPWLGIVMQNDVDGVRIVRVANQGPAAAGGILPGDILSQVGETEVKTTHELKRAVQKTTVGMAVDIQLSRDGALITLEVTPEALPELRNLAR